MMPRALLALLMLVALPLWAAEPKELTWSEMIPPDAAPEVPNMTPLHDLSQMSSALESAPAARQDMPNAPVVKNLDGQNIRLPGYIVPLEVSEEGRTTEFLLVPYFGACIHTPPPPANQIVHVRSQAPIKGFRTMDAIWVSGKLELTRTPSNMGVSGYAMIASTVTAYKASGRTP